MSKRATARTDHSPKAVAAVWTGLVLSTLLLLVAANAVLASLKAFRSCSANNGLVINVCGKQSLNPGDFILFGLLVLAALLFVSMAAAAWRSIPRRKG